MALGETTENFIDTNTPLRFMKGVYQIKHSCLITGMKRLRMFRQPKVELTFALFVHKLNVDFCLQGYPKHIYKYLRIMAMITEYISPSDKLCSTG